MGGNGKSEKGKKSDKEKKINLELTLMTGYEELPPDGYIDFLGVGGAGSSSQQNHNWQMMGDAFGSSSSAGNAAGIVAGPALRPLATRATHQFEEGSVLRTGLATPSRRKLTINDRHPNNGRKACVACGSMFTPVWRRGPNWEALCNACGLKYHRSLRK